MIMSKRAITIIIHITCWALFLLLPVIFSPAFGTRPKEFDHVFGYPLRFILNNLFLVPFFYFNAYFLVPELFFKRKNILYFGAILLLLLMFLLIPEDRQRIININNVPPPTSFPDRERLRIMHERPNILFIGFRILPRIFSFCLVWLLGTMLQVIERWRIAEKRSRESELEKVNAELSYLKLQINPHFLFNTLNNIYSLASMQSAQTPAAVMKLSEIMRYVTQDAQADMVPLEKEIQYINNYIELQKMRSNDRLELVFNAGGDFSKNNIAPLLLISFVENGFKYGISNHEKSLISIDIRVEKDTLEMQVHNTIFERPENGVTSSIGMSNTRRRLELLYPGRHALSFGKTGNFYTVDLKIELS
ncbi:MAG: sensor histidine kinase [Chitinophagaceae bacterium]|nr:sensor histidine kinase [Chitinophagaceae bacterium]